MDSKAPSTTLLDLFSNSLILQYTAPYVPITSLLNLAATSKQFQSLIFHTPSVFRYLNLSTIKTKAVCSHHIGSSRDRKSSAQYSLLYKAFPFLARRDVLEDVRVLVLDGLSVPQTLLHDILCYHRHHQPMCSIRWPEFASENKPCPTCYPVADECTVPENVRILSIRECNGLSEGYLMDLFSHVAQLSRLEDSSPQVRGIYYFGPKDRGNQDFDSGNARNVYSGGVTTTLGSQLGMQGGSTQLGFSGTDRLDPWYTPGRIGYGFGCARAGGLGMKSRPGWGEVLSQCKGVLFFDATTCQSPHGSGPGGKNTRTRTCPILADVCLGAQVCQDCHSAPHGGVRYTGELTMGLPLLSPPPLHSSSIAVAQRVSHGAIDTKDLTAHVRCDECLQERYCQGCMAFWCETCFSFEPIDDGDGAGSDSSEYKKIKVYLGLCTEKCLVEEMYIGAGSGGMWG